MTAEERLLMEDETKEQRWNPRMQGFAHHNARTGFLEGEMALPRHDAYTVEFTISKRNPMAADLGDPTDRCTVKLGPNLRNLQEVAVAKNVVDEYAGRARRGKLQVGVFLSGYGRSHSARSEERLRPRRLRALRVHARPDDRYFSLEV